MADTIIPFDEKRFQAMQTAAAKYYKGKHFLLSGKDGIPPVEVIPINDPIVDKLLAGSSDVGGLPEGGLIEISGGASGGKTTLALEFLSSIAKQKPDRGIGFTDFEHALDISYAEYLGVPVKEARFAYSRPQDGQEGLEVMRRMIKSGMYSAWIVDSWAAIQPPVNDKPDREVGDNQMMGLAKLSSDALREIKPLLREYGCTLIILNQQRIKFGPHGPMGMQTTGGGAVEFYSDLRLQIKRPSKDSDERLISVLKSKTQALPFSECVVVIKHGQGIDHLESIVNMALEEGHIALAGAWYSFTWKQGKPVQGREKLLEILRTDDMLRNELCKLLKTDTFVPRLPFVKRVLGGSLLAVNEEE